MTMIHRSPSSPSEDAREESTPQLDHVGILVRDLELATTRWQSRLNVSIAHTFEAPSLALRATFLAIASANIELYTIDDPNVLDLALGRASAKLDHIALRFDGNARELDLAGCTIRGPGRPDPIGAPFLIADSEHVWTEPPGIDVLLQLITSADSTP